VKKSRGDLVPLARITKPHGVRGELRVFPLSGESQNLGTLKKVHVRSDSGTTRAFDVEGCRPHKNLFLIKLVGVDGFDAAKALVGRELLAQASDLAPLEEGEHYWFELVGLRVLTHDGKDIGVVENLFATGANDVLVVRQGDRERLLPYIDEVVAEVDLDAGVLRLSDMEGLEEL